MTDAPTNPTPEIRRFDDAAVNAMVGRAMSRLDDGNRIGFVVTGEKDETGVKLAIAIKVGDNWSASGYTRKKDNGKRLVGGELAFQW